MSEAFVRFRFGLRLLLLVVALLAAFLAGRHAIVERHRSEWDLQRAPLESHLDQLEKWSTEGHRNLPAAEDVPFRQELSKNLARINADMIAREQRLKSDSGFSLVNSLLIDRPERKKPAPHVFAGRDRP
jgi:hypothetical protein